MEQLPAPPNRRVPLRRDPARQAIAGVAYGLGDHLGIPVTLVRIAFVLLTVFGAFSGAILYAVLWVLVPVAAPEEAPGLEAATRGGRRPTRRRSGVDVGVVISIAMILLGIAWLVFYDTFLSTHVFWPLVLGGAGVVLIWLQVDQSSQARIPAQASTWEKLTRGSGAASLVRLAGGLILFGLGISWILATQIGVAQLPGVLAATLAILGAILVVAAPWLHQQRLKVGRAEEERMRAEAKADLAAHLHDSVLQTLTLIQRQAGDAEAVATLARRQERELRTWLFGDQTTTTRFRGAVEEIAADIESRFPIAVELVCVGDDDLDDDGRALLLAAREATTNAAKHARVDRIDLYAEIDADQIEVFIRDRGVGFDPEVVPADRVGVKESIRARMHRHGGEVTIRSAPGEGTEVKLEMKR